MTGKYGGIPPFEETQNYVVRITGFFNAYAGKITGVDQVGTFDPRDMAIAEAKEVADVHVLTQRMEALERRLAERTLVDFVRPEKAKAEAPIEREPKLAAEIVAREETERQAESAAVDIQAPGLAEQAARTFAPQVHLDFLKPPKTISVARMNKFTLKLQAQET